MQAGLSAGEVAANVIMEGNWSQECLKEYEKRWQDENVRTFHKYLKAKEYLLSLSDEELDSIAQAFKGSDFERISPTALLKKLFKVLPKP